MEEGFQEGIKKPSKAWYLLPIFLCILGGIIGYFVLRKRNNKFAIRLLIVGAIMTAVWVVLSIVFAGLAYMYIGGVFNAKIASPCSPCFLAGSALTYVDHSADALVLRVGPSDISNTKVIVGGTSVDGIPASNPSGTDITFTSTGLFRGDVPITVTYADTSSGLTHTVTATLHRA